MLTILQLFGRSPFAPLELHMKQVGECIALLESLFIALLDQKFDAVQSIANEIDKKEAQADCTKNDIRNHLPKSLFLPINHSQLLSILSIQDSIADRAEDTASLATIKDLTLPAEVKETFLQFLEKVLDTFKASYTTIKELHDLLESSFTGVEAEKVKQMAEQVSLKERQADEIQHTLLKALVKHEEKMSYASFYLWQRLFQQLSSIADLSENLADQIRMTLELK